MKEYRCRRCNWLLFKGRLTEAVVEVKCRRGTCGHMNTIGVKVDNAVKVA